MNSKTAIAITVVFIACCSNIFLLELVLTEDPGAGIFVTFLRFLFIAIIGFCTVGKLGTAKPRIPLRKYLLYVVFYWTSSVANSYAFEFNISMPLHMIFRAGSLIANMVMGVWILKKKYPPLKYLAIFMISTGIAICTIQSSGDVKAPREIHQDALEEEKLKLVDWLWWCAGIAILTMSLFISARLSIFQETLYSRYGKHPWEVMYYTHLLPLVLWLPTTPKLINHIGIAVASPHIESIIVAIPRQVLYLILFIISKVACTSATSVLSSECTSLTVTLTITLRKFISLVFSIYYFRNPFTAGHWVATFFVFLGSLIFTEVPQKIVTLALLFPSSYKKKCE